MSLFKNLQSASIKNDQSSVEDYKVQRLDQDDYLAVGKHNPAHFQAPVVSGHKKKYSSNLKSSKKFEINHLIRDALALDAEEKEYIDKEVDRIISEIRDQATKQGYDEGFKAGSDVGEKEALVKYSAEMQEKIGIIENLISYFESCKNQILEANKAFFIKLVMRVARKIILKETSSDEEYVYRLIHSLVEKMGTRENILIRLNPKNYSNLENVETKLKESIGQLKNFHIESSDTVPEGECAVDTDWQSIQTSLDSELEKFETELLNLGPNQNE